LYLGHGDIGGDDGGAPGDPPSGDDSPDERGGAVGDHGGDGGGRRRAPSPPPRAATRAQRRAGGDGDGTAGGAARARHAHERLASRVVRLRAGAARPRDRDDGRGAPLGSPPSLTDADDDEPPRASPFVAVPRRACSLTTDRRDGREAGVGACSSVGAWRNPLLLLPEALAVRAGDELRVRTRVRNLGVKGPWYGVELTLLRRRAATPADAAPRRGPAPTPTPSEREQRGEASATDGGDGGGCGDDDGARGGGSRDDGGADDPPLEVVRTISQTFNQKHFFPWIEPKQRRDRGARAAGDATAS